MKSLDESLNDYLSVEELHGDNQYFCESCKSRVNATRSIKLRTLPPVLNFQLKRCVFLPKVLKIITSIYWLSVAKCRLRSNHQIMCVFMLVHSVKYRTFIELPCWFFNCEKVLIKVLTSDISFLLLIFLIFVLTFPLGFWLLLLLCVSRLQQRRKSHLHFLFLESWICGRG